MNATKNFHTSGNQLAIPLQSKFISDSVHSEKKKPEFSDSGFHDMIGDVVSPIIAESHLTASEKIAGTWSAMSDSVGYFRIPRSLFNEPSFEEARLDQQMVLIKIIALAVYENTPHDISGITIILKRGQLCYTLRKLALKIGCGVQILRTCLGRYATSGILTHTLTHGKTIITITHKDTYDLINPPPNTDSNTKLTQNQHTKKEDKNLDIPILPKPPNAGHRSEDASAAPADPIKFDGKKNEWVGIEEGHIVDWQEAYPGLDIRLQLNQMKQWMIANPERKARSKYRAFIVRWLSKQQNYLSNNAKPLASSHRETVKPHRPGGFSNLPPQVQEDMKRILDKVKFNNTKSCWCSLQEDTIVYFQGNEQKVFEINQQGRVEKLNNLLKNMGLCK